MKLKVSAVAALSVTAAALGGCSDSDPDASRPEGFYEQCVAYYDAMCARAERCLKPWVPYDVDEQVETLLDYEHCVWDLTYTCGNLERGTLALGYISYHPSGFDACMESFDDPCEGANAELRRLWDSLTADLCPDFMRGTKPRLDGCSEAIECRESHAECAPTGLCTGALSGEAYERECTSYDPSVCSGLHCMELKPNYQRRPGICTLPCTGDLPCGPGAACVQFPELDTGGACLSVCATDADCSGGFACRDTVDGGGLRVCLVEACPYGICPCEIDCSGGPCSDDGCGGYCPGCEPPETCGGGWVWGECGCTPSCEDRECGSDGCFGECGSCDELPGSFCNQQQQCDCAPGCGSVECGDDGCGGTCGTCPDGALCVDGTCQ